MMRGVFEKLVDVSQDEEIPEGLAETAEDLVSADVMNHPVRQIRRSVSFVDALVHIFSIRANLRPHGSKPTQLAVVPLLAALIFVREKKD